MVAIQFYYSKDAEGNKQLVACPAPGSAGLNTKAEVEEALACLVAEVAADKVTGLYPIPD